MARNRRPSVVPTVIFHGAARTVTGSMHRVDALGHSLLLDCGFFQGARAVAYQRNSTFAFRPKDINAVLLSHAHIDHCGNLPNLIKQGFLGPIYCTAATRALVAVMLGDAAKIQQEDANYLNRHRAKGEPEIEPLYGEGGVYKTLLRLKAIAYNTPFEVFPGIQATFHDAGHLLGSAMIHLRFHTPERDHTLTFTGDLGRTGIPILRPPAPVPAADVILCESTYGGHTHEPITETAEHLGVVVRRTVERGGKVIIPAFSVGRTQTVLYYLHQLMNARRLPAVPIYVDSPMSLRATEVFRAHPECFDEEGLKLLREHPDLFGERHVRYIDKVHESIALNHQPEPCVIISASGMCEGGRVVHHIKHNLEDRRSAILLVGFQAEGTLGRRLMEASGGSGRVRVLGRELEVRAEVVMQGGLSSHADQPTILAALTPHVTTTRTVRLIHGELDRATVLAEALRGIGFADVAVPEPGECLAFA